MQRPRRRTVQQHEPCEPLESKTAPDRPTTPASFAGRKRGALQDGEAPQRRVAILGGGFGGLYEARRLERTLAARQDLDVVQISRENYLLFTPMLNEVAAGVLDPRTSSNRCGECCDACD